jgi:Protoglobin
MTTQVAGYTYGTNDVAHSPLTLDDLNLLKQTVLLTEDDGKYLRLAGEVLADQIDAVLDVWYSFVGSHPHLAQYFSTSDHQLRFVNDFINGFWTPVIAPMTRIG